jgi:hypothetical protein
MPELESPLTPPNEDSGAHPLIASAYFQPQHLYYHVGEKGVLVCNRAVVGEESKARPKEDDNSCASVDEATIAEKMKGLGFDK